MQRPKLAASFLRSVLGLERSAAVPALCNPAWDWEALVALAAREHVLPSLHGQLEDSPFRPLVPAEIQQFLAAVEQLNRERNAAAFAELAFVVQLLNSVGIEPVLLKGAAYLVTGIYRETGSRYLVDLDLLIPKERMGQAVGLLLENGFRDEIEDSFGRFRHHYPPLQRRGGIVVELHHSLGPAICSSLLEPEEMIRRSILAGFRGGAVRLPSADDLFVHLVLHSQIVHPYHERIWPPFRAMFDLLLLERRFGKELDWKSIQARFKSAGQSDLLLLCLSQVCRDLGMPVPIPIRLGASGELRWRRRSLLRRFPALRYLDPIYMCSSLLMRRLRTLLASARTAGGRRLLFTQLFQSVNYHSLFSELFAGRGK